MVLLPPREKKIRQRLRLELAWLQLKEKLFGPLTEKDKKRRDEIIRRLAVVF